MEQATANQARGVLFVDSLYNYVTKQRMNTFSLVTPACSRNGNFVTYRRRKRGVL